MFSKAELMPHQIRITDVRCERLQDISDSECLREGVQYIEEIEKYYLERTDREEGFYFDSPREASHDFSRGLSRLSLGKISYWS